MTSTIEELQAENEQLRQRVEELEHTVDTLRLYELLFENMPFPAVLYRQDGIIININPAMETLVQAPRESINDTYNILTNPAAREGGYTNAFMQAQEGKVVKLPAIPYDLVSAGHVTSSQPQRVWTEPTYFPLTKDMSTRSYIGSVVIDVTEQMQQAEALKQAQLHIEAQQDTLRELSTPLIPITDTVVIMPLIGAIDSLRAKQIMETLLNGVALHQARMVILDITGVAMVDTQVAQAFIQAAQAVKLLGAQVMITGIQPRIAQTLIELGADLSSILTRGSLQAGIVSVFSERNNS